MLKSVVEMEKMYDFSHSVGHFDNNVRIPIQTFVNKKGNIQDHRPLSNCNPYKYINYLFDILNIKRKEFFSYENVVNEMSKESENDSEIKEFFKTQMDNYKNEIKLTLQNLYSKVSPNERDLVMKNVQKIQSKFSSQINECLIERKLDEARNLMNQLVEEIKNCEPTGEINLDDELEIEVI